MQGGDGRRDLEPMVEPAVHDTVRERVGAETEVVGHVSGEGVFRDQTRPASGVTELRPSATNCAVALTCLSC